MQSVQNFRLLVLISNVLGMLSLLTLFLGIKFPNIVSNYFALVLGVLLFLLTIYLLIVFLNNKKLRVKKYDALQLIVRLSIPVLIFYYFFTYN